MILAIFFATYDEGSSYMLLDLFMGSLFKLNLKISLSYLFLISRLRYEAFFQIGLLIYRNRSAYLDHAYSNVFVAIICILSSLAYYIFVFSVRYILHIATCCSGDYLLSIF